MSNRHAALGDASEGLPAHPLADAFPLLQGQDLDELVEDIKVHGLLSPIITLDGLVLDGRNRQSACLLAGIPPRYEAFSGEDPRAYVISVNLRRRHMDASQLAMAAAKLANWKLGDNQHTAGSANLQTLSQSEAAELLNVSPRSVATAAVVRDHAIPELVRKVEAGEISVSAAAKVAKLPQEEQEEIVAGGREQIISTAKHIRGTLGTGNDEWYTPVGFVEAAREVLGWIDLDPASNDIAQKTVQATRYFTKGDNGLAQEWSGSIWLNPPYSDNQRFIEKLVFHLETGDVPEAVLLTHNYTDTKWNHLARRHASAICYTEGRIKFIDTMGSRAAPTQGQMFFYFGPNPKWFAEVFKEKRIGAVEGNLRLHMPVVDFHQMMTVPPAEWRVPAMM